jgi:hypothetical protein
VYQVAALEDLSGVLKSTLWVIAAAPETAGDRQQINPNDEDLTQFPISPWACRQNAGWK